MRRTLTRDQVLSWREGWSHSDLDKIAHALDVLGETDYYEPPSRQYIGARVDGRVALNIAPGYLYWTSTRFSDLIDVSMFPGGLGGGETNGARWYALSTFQRRDDATPSFDELRAPCPTCWMEPSASGECGCE